MIAVTSNLEKYVLEHFGRNEIDTVEFDEILNKCTLSTKISGWNVIALEGKRMASSLNKDKDNFIKLFKTVNKSVTVIVFLNGIAVKKLMWVTAEFPKVILVPDKLSEGVVINNIVAVLNSIADDDDDAIISGVDDINLVIKEDPYIMPEIVEENVKAKRYDFLAKPVPEPEPIPTPVFVNEPEPVPEPEPEFRVDLPEYEDVVEDAPAPTQDDNLYQRLEKINDVENNMSEILQSIKKDRVIKDLLNESSEYQSVLLRLGELEKALTRVVLSDDILPSEKYDKILEVCTEKAFYKNMENSLLTNHVKNILNLVSVKTVEYMVTQTDKIAKSTKNSHKKDIQSNNKILIDLAEQRLEIQTSLVNKLQALQSIMNGMVNLNLDVREAFLKGYPSNNAYINNVLAPIKVAPEDLINHTKELLISLREGTIAFSKVEGTIVSLIQALYDYYEVSNDFREVQSKLIEANAVHNIEDIVMIDNALKRSLRIFVGTENSGKTVTALMVGTALQRRGNVLIVDMTKERSLDKYINKSVELSSFNDGLVCNDILYAYNDLTNFKDILQILTESTGHYRDIILIFDNKHNSKLLKDIHSCSLTLTYVLQPDISQVNAIKKVFAELREPNIARRLVTVDSAIDAPELFELMSIDIGKCQYTDLPNLKKVKAASLRRYNPGLYPEIRELIEGAFNLVPTS